MLPPIVQNQARAHQLGLGLTVRAQIESPGRLRVAQVDYSIPELSPFLDLVLREGVRRFPKGPLFRGPCAAIAPVYPLGQERGFKAPEKLLSGFLSFLRAFFLINTVRQSGCFWARQGYLLVLQLLGVISGLQTQPVLQVIRL